MRRVSDGMQSCMRSDALQSRILCYLGVRNSHDYACNQNNLVPQAAKS
jgi:hypothetical protein